MTGSSPASSAVATARRSTLVPPSWRNNLLRPIRLEVPAARTTAATRPERSSVMDASAFLAQVLGTSPRMDGEHLGHDADGHLLRSVGADVEPHRREEALPVTHAELPKDVLLSRARTEEADVGDGLVLDRAHPFAVVLQGMHLDHHERAAVEAQVLHSVLGPAQDEPGWRRESCLGEVRAPVVDHRHREPRPESEGGEGPRVVARPAEAERGRG